MLRFVERSTQQMMDRVFISYVSEDLVQIQHLVGELEREGVPVWFDQRDIDGGVPWIDAIRDAVRRAPFFVACFSSRVELRDSSTMFEELQVAVEELRRRLPGRAWLIPVRLEPCQIPPLPLPNARTLRDLHYIEMFPDFEVGLARLLRVIKGQPTGNTPRSAPSGAPFGADVRTDDLDVGEADEISIANVEGASNAQARSAQARLRARIRKVGKLKITNRSDGRDDE